MTDAARRHLGAIALLAAGLFVGVALLPVAWTGPLGSTLGHVLWAVFGLGALAFPLLGLGLGLVALYDEPGGLDGRRAVLALVGLAVLVPFLVAVVAGVRAPAFDPPMAERALPARLSGLLPGLLAHYVLGTVGVVGGLVLGAGGLAALAVVAFGWHPPAWRRVRAPAPEPTDGGGRARGAARSGDVPGPVGLPAAAGDDAEAAELSGMAAAGAPPRPAERAAPRPSVRRRATGERPTEAAAEGPMALPPVELLAEPPPADRDAGAAQLDKLGQSLLETLRTFKVEATLAGRTTGPVVTQFEVVPAPGVKAQRIVGLADDLAIAMRVPSIRVAPIPGKGAVGIEVPNPKPRMVTLRELFEDPAWTGSRAALPIALGRDLEGRAVVTDLAKTPHLLIAGATGSGKSVAINTIVTSLVYRHTPAGLRLLLVDPKMVELSLYNALPHLRHTVVTRNDDAATLLKWAVYEMQRRYELLQVNGARNLADFNAKVAEGKPLRVPGAARAATLAEVSAETPDTPPPPRDDTYREGPLPYVVVIIDELADLMMTVQAEVETPLAMLAQKARAIGIHLILATQRPSVNVITGLIKANFPSRIAFRVASKVDSRTILDQNGAEALLGNGDMLFLPPGASEPMRLQGAFIGTVESERVMDWFVALREGGVAAPATPATEEDILAVIRAQEQADEGGGARAGEGDRDPLFREAAELCIGNQGGSTSLLQRRLSIGYGRAARIIDQLHFAGILGPPDGSKPREVLIGAHQLDEYAGEG